MSRFRKPVQVFRRTEGAYVNGRWVDGDYASVGETILANIQPATASDYDRMVPETGGRRIERMIRVYTGAALNVAGENDVNGDQIYYLGERYTVIAVSPWLQGRLAHYRYLAAREINNAAA